MRRTRLWLAVLIMSTFIFEVDSVHGQQDKRVLLQTNGWGRLSGKVTFAGKVPASVDLTEKMQQHADKECCLDPKARQEEKSDQTWLVDPKTRGIANVYVYLKPPEGKYFPIHEKYRNRNETITINAPHCAFVPRIAAFNPSYFDGKKEVWTGQKLIFKNSALISHNFRALGGNNVGFGSTLPPDPTNLNMTRKLPPYKLPYTLNCDVHPWMAGKLFVFDHPYYAITKADGTFELPIVPAGAEVALMAWHEGVGYVLTNKGKAMKLQPGKNVVDFEVVSPEK